MFLNLEPQSPEFNQFEQLQEDLLRGQFSLFPVAVNTGFWHSPRKIGIDARKKLQDMIRQRVKGLPPAWLSPRTLHPETIDETVNHLLMATSSLAVKGFSSLLTALLLNTFLFRSPDSSAQSIATWISSSQEVDRRAKREALWKETLRLSPPIVGVMRRTSTQQILVNREEHESDVLIPQGWDVWPYFPGGNRDPSVFGPKSDDFNPLRYMERDRSLPEPIAFGFGSKRCLGQPFVKAAAMAVLGRFETQGIGLDGAVDAAGVRGWLGWERQDPGTWAKDMKQLPTEHPANPIMVRFTRR